MKEFLETVADELRRMLNEGCETVALDDDSLKILRRMNAEELAAEMRAEIPSEDEPEEVKFAGVDDLKIESKKEQPRERTKIVKNTPNYGTIPPPTPFKLPDATPSEKWSALRDIVLSDPICNAHVKPGKKVVFGVGNLSAKIFFCGEAPGADEKGVVLHLHKEGAAHRRQDGEAGEAHRDGEEPEKGRRAPRRPAKIAQVRSFVQTRFEEQEIEQDGMPVEEQHQKFVVTLPEEVYQIGKSAQPGQDGEQQGEAPALTLEQYITGDIPAEPEAQAVAPRDAQPSSKGKASGKKVETPAPAANEPLPDAKEFLERDNQLRMSLQFVKSLPKIRTIH